MNKEKILAPVEVEGLMAVPNVMHNLTIKATLSGITVLREGRFKKRYLGNKYSSVDINGKLWLKSGDLKKHLRGNNEKKCRPIKACNADIENTPGVPKDTNLTPTNRKKSYKVNKLEVRQRILGMLHTKKGKKELYFWTVTFPQNISDDIAYRAFNTWLTTLRSKKMLREYIWVAERQQNGTVHFHIGIPHKMSVVAANRMMRIILTNFARRRIIESSVYLMKRYNGVDIAKNRKTGRVTNFAIKKGSRALATYLTKYVTKNDSPFSHLAWHNSRGYSALFTGITLTTSEFIGLGWKDFVLHKSVISNEFFMFFPWRSEPPEPFLRHITQLNDLIQRLMEKK
jgi:hypothetical protein